MHLATNNDENISDNERSPLIIPVQATASSGVRMAPRHSICWVKCFFIKLFNDEFYFIKDFPGRWGEVTRIDLSTPPDSSIEASIVTNEVYDPDISTDSTTTNSLKDRIRNFFRKKDETDSSHKLLGEWHATAIAGNDISSSCLYTAGICAQRGN
jgi:hypothetical protein